MQEGLDQHVPQLLQAFSEYNFRMCALDSPKNKKHQNICLLPTHLVIKGSLEDSVKLSDSLEHLSPVVEAVCSIYSHKDGQHHECQ